MGILGQLITLLFVIGVVGAYFWPIALTLAAAYLSYRLVLHRSERLRWVSGSRVQVKAGTDVALSA